MDDLISRKSLLSAYDEKHKGPAGGARKLIEDEPSVPAVPLDKLCEWLGEHHAYYSYFVMDKFAWRKVLTEWMEEQDAAD